MNILLIADRQEVRQKILNSISRLFEHAVTEAPSIQEGIEFLEERDQMIDLIICDYPGKSSVLVKGLLDVVGKTPLIFGKSPEVSFECLSEHPMGPGFHVVERELLPQRLLAVLDLWIKSGTIQPRPTPDSDFVRFDTKILFLGGPIQADIYVRLADNRYCKLFKRGDKFDAGELEAYLKNKKIPHFYLEKADAGQMLERQNLYLSQLTDSAIVNRDQSRNAVEGTLDLIHTLISESGFSLQTQELAKKSVVLTLKLMGNSPRLAQILGELRYNQGKYITSHSIMLAEIASAIANRIGCGSSSIFMKLTLAAFLHDLPIRNNYLAAHRHVREVEGKQFSAEEVHTFQMHPINAAEYARNFPEVPVDVATIIVQHHEQPDGSGFPRGLYHHQIVPLSCIFIVAHDLLDFFLNRDENATMTDFYDRNHLRYSKGFFRKIVESMTTGTPISAFGGLPLAS